MDVGPFQPMAYTAVKRSMFYGYSEMCNFPCAWDQTSTHAHLDCCLYLQDRSTHTFTTISQPTSTPLSHDLQTHAGCGHHAAPPCLEQIAGAVWRSVLPSLAASQQTHHFRRCTRHRTGNSCAHDLLMCPTGLARPTFPLRSRERLSHISKPAPA